MSQAIQGELARDRRPGRVLVIAANLARDVEAPLLPLGGTVAQRGKGNAKLGVPASVVPPSRYAPTAVPIDVEAATRPALQTPIHAAAALALVRQLPVVLDPGGVRTEDEAVLFVFERVEDQFYGIALIEIVVADRLAHYDPRRLGV